MIAIIPARYSSIRLPGKMLLPIAGKPLILHTLERAKEARKVDRVIVATDDVRILNAVIDSGNEAVMTRAEHNSGSDRIAEVAEGLPEGSIIVNVQGDEPMISPKTIDAVIEVFTGRNARLNERAESRPTGRNASVNERAVRNPVATAPGSDKIDIATACGPINDLSELLNFNVVKVALGEQGNALYFSRSPMPFPREASLRHSGDPNAAIRNEPEICSIFRRHIGIYVYRREYLLEFAKMPQTRLEKIEMLEQLRALENGAIIGVAEMAEVSNGVDTLEDLDRVKLEIEFPGIAFRPGSVDDIPAISQTYIDSVRHSFADVLPAEYLQNLSVERRSKVFTDRAQNESYRIIIAENESKEIVGFIDYARLESGNFGLEGRIFSFYFVPEFQRRGLGSLLFRKCFALMRGECYQSVCLDAFEANPYRAFYEKMNGRVVGHDSHEIDGEPLPTVFYGWDDLSKI